MTTAHTSFAPARPATDQDVTALVTLWTARGLTRPHNHAPTDIAFARKSPNADVLVMETDGRIIASVMVGHDGHRGWVYYVAVDPTYQRHGLGRHIMAEAERWLIEKGIWKMHLIVRKSNQAMHTFYDTLGFVQEDVIAFSKRLKPMPHIDPKAPL